MGEFFQDPDHLTGISPRYHYYALRQFSWRKPGMNKSAVTGFVVGAIVVTAAGAVAGYRVVSASRGAEVVCVKALSKTIKTPRQECHDVQASPTKPVRYRERLVGTGVWAVVGGLLGHEVGGGSGKALATVAGAAAGGYARNKNQQKGREGGH